MMRNFGVLHKICTLSLKVLRHPVGDDSKRICILLNSGERSPTGRTAYERLLCPRPSVVLVLLVLLALLVPLALNLGPPGDFRC